MSAEADIAKYDLWDAIHTPLILIHDDVIERMNRACRRLGLSDDLLGQPLHVLLADHDRTSAQALLSPENSAEVVLRTCLLLAQDNARWVEITSAPVDPTNTRVRLLTLRDIEREVALQQQISSEHERDQIVSRLTSSFQYSAVIQADGRIVNEWISPSLTDVTGYTCDDMREMANWEAIVHPDDVPILHQQFHDMVTCREAIVEYRIVIASGDERWVRSWATAVRAPNERRIRRFFGAVQDITDQVRAEERVRLSESRLENVIRHLPLVVFTINRSGIITFAAGTMESRPFPLGENVGRSIYDLYADQDEFLRDTAQVLAGETIEREREYHGHIYQTYYAPLHDPQGQPIGALGMGMDITERRRMEQAMLEYQGVRAALQKELELSELKSRMMRRISHEFRTPLATIQLSAQMMERYADRMSASDRAVRVEHILDRVRHLIALLEDIALVVQARSHPLTFNRYRFDLSQLCAAVVDAFRQGVGAHHTWQIHISDEARVVTADAHLIGLILQNLLSNAIKFSEAGSSIALSASVENDELILRVRDSGIGILPEEQAHVFEPFFRGSNFDERAGLGLGLSIVRDAVAKHEGHIHLESTPGAGTTIDIYLPLSDAARS